MKEEAQWREQFCSQDFSIWLSLASREFLDNTFSQNWAKCFFLNEPHFVFFTSLSEDTSLLLTAPYNQCIVHCWSVWEAGDGWVSGRKTLTHYTSTQGPGTPSSGLLVRSLAPWPQVLPWNRTFLSVQASFWLLSRSPSFGAREIVHGFVTCLAHGETGFDLWQWPSESSQNWSHVTPQKCFK